jgi:hypothetical protein
MRQCPMDLARAPRTLHHLRPRHRPRRMQFGVLGVSVAVAGGWGAQPKYLGICGAPRADSRGPGVGLAPEPQALPILAAALIP